MFDIERPLSVGAQGASELSDTILEVSEDIGSSVVLASSSSLLFSAEEPELLLMFLFSRSCKEYDL